MTLHPIGSYPMCKVDNPGQETPFYVATGLPDGSTELTYLVIMKPFKLGSLAGGGLRATPMGKLPMNVITNNAGLSGIVQLNYSDTGYTSPSIGNNPDTNFEGRVSQPLRLTWTLPIVPEGDRRVALEISSIELINADGALDALLNSYDVGGREASVLLGMKSSAFDKFTPVWSGRLVDWAQDYKTVQITGRDTSYQLDLPAQQTHYAGIGGAEGTSDIANRPKPLCYGPCGNITAILIDPSNLIYQFHDGAAQDVSAVYDKGVALTAGATYSTYAALVAATVAAGSFAIAPAVGMFKLGSNPVGQVTADVIGDAVANATANSAATLFKRIITSRGGINASMLDQNSLDVFDARYNDTQICIYEDGSEAITIADLLSKVLATSNGWWGSLPDGTFTIGAVDVPLERDVAAELQVWDIRDVAIIANPDGSWPPRSRQQIAYQRLWTVQGPTDLAGAVSQSQVVRLGQPYSIYADVSATAQANYLLAQDPPILEGYGNSSSPTTMARILSMLGVQRQTFRVSVGPIGHRIPRGACVAITHPRVNGGQRWLARFIGCEIDASSREVDLILWG